MSLAVSLLIVTPIDVVRPVFVVAFVLAAICAIAFEARAYTKAAFKDVRDQCAEVIRNGCATPHVIAHSYGAFLVGLILTRCSDIRFGRIILVGSVLPRGFPWTRVRGDAPHAFASVRNEAGLKDWVAWLASIAGVYRRDLGASGLFGFRGAGVHTVRSARHRCTLCQVSGAEALVHNVLAPLPHIGPLKSPGYPREIWLPYIWGYPTHEYLDFVDHAEALINAEADRDDPILRRTEQELLERRWAWLKSDDTLRTYLRKRLEMRGKRARLGLNVTDQLVGRTLRLLVTRFVDARVKNEPEMYPIKALELALDVVMEGHHAG